MHRFVVCSKTLSSNKHGLLSRVKVTRTPVDLYGTDVSKIDFVPEIISKAPASCAAGFEQVQIQHTCQTLTHHPDICK